MHTKVWLAYEVWLVYEGKSLSFAEIIEKDNPVTIDQRNFQVLASETFKVKNKILLG